MTQKHIVIIGAGTSGIQGACHYLAFLASHGWTVTLIHSPSINILGIGESTNPPFVESLEDGANFNILDDLKELDAMLIGEIIHLLYLFLQVTPLYMLILLK